MSVWRSVTGALSSWRAAANAARADREDLDGDAIAACRAVIAQHSKSFALASRVFEPHIRDRAAVIYTWCRNADDAVDLATGDRRQVLAEQRSILDSVYRGEPQRDITLRAFQQVIEVCRLPRAYPEELLAGMEMDVVGTDYDTMDTLLLYCFRVAGTVGLMMSHAMGVSDDKFLRNATHLGLAMQLTNICRDVAEDWQMGRLYVPDQLLGEFGLSDLRSHLGGPFPDRARAGMARAVQVLLAEAERFYRSGDRGLPGLSWRCAFAVRAARQVYSAIGERIAAQDHDVTRGRAFVSQRDKLHLLAEAGATALGELPERWHRRQHRQQTGEPGPRVPGRVIGFPQDVLPLGE